MPNNSIQKSFNNMNADTKNNILSMALEAKQLELERARMQLEDQQAKIIEQSENVIEQVSYVQSILYNRRQDRTAESMYEAASNALDILEGGDANNYY